MDTRKLALLIMVTCAVPLAAQGIPFGLFGQRAPEKDPTASWFGNTGLIYVPSANFSTGSKASGGIHFLEYDESQEVRNATTSVVPSLELSLTQMRDIPKANTPNQYTDDEVVSAKWNFALTDWLQAGDVLGVVPEVSLGVWDIADNVNRSFYVVGSKSLDFGPQSLLSGATFTVGYASSEGNTKPDDKKLGGLDGIFAGVELTPMQQVRAQAEYDTEDFNFSLRYYPSNVVSLDVGLIDGEPAYGLSARSPL